MEGYYEDKGIGEGGELRIAITNIAEYKKLIEQAKKETSQLERTINQLQKFELSVAFDMGNGCGISNLVHHE